MGVKIQWRVWFWLELICSSAGSPCGHFHDELTHCRTQMVMSCVNAACVGHKHCDSLTPLCLPLSLCLALQLIHADFPVREEMSQQTTWYLVAWEADQGLSDIFESVSKLALHRVPFDNEKRKTGRNWINFPSFLLSGAAHANHSEKPYLPRKQRLCTAWCYLFSAC